MNKYKINLTSQFNRELEDIYYYIYFCLYSPRAANRIYNKIKNTILSLDTSPERYSRILNIKQYENMNIRKMPIERYIVIYEVNNNTKEVFILHIFHGSQNYINLL